MNVAEIKLSFKSRTKAKERTTITGAKSVYTAFLSQWDKGLIDYQEQFKVMLLNNANHVLGIFDLAKGSRDCVPVYLRIIFATALKTSATSRVWKIEP